MLNCISEALPMRRYIKEALSTSFCSGLSIKGVNWIPYETTWLSMWSNLAWYGTGNIGLAKCSY